MPSIYQPAEDSFLLAEVLKKEISNLIKENKNLKFLEIGSGSGILLETANKIGLKREHIFSVDINQEAVKHCQKLGFKCILSNLFENVEGEYDVIIFNPPYLPKDSKESSDSQLSTTGGKQGGEITNKFLSQAKNYLKKGGKIFLLISSLTKNINWQDYHKKLITIKKLFMEELIIYELMD